MPSSLPGLTSLVTVSQYLSYPFFFQPSDIAHYSSLPSIVIATSIRNVDTVSVLKTVFLPEMK